MEDLHLVQKEMIKFLKRLGDIYPQDIKAAFRELHAKLKVFENDPYEKRAFLYLDVLSWLHQFGQRDSSNFTYIVYVIKIR